MAAWVRLLIACLATALLAACGPREPVRIGFIATLTGRLSDLGEAGRNGAQIAVDEINAAGGIRGRPVELIVQDDAQSPEKAIEAINHLRQVGVELVIGPMTSSMAEVILPIAQKSGIVLISPTVTAHKFFGRDDNLFLIMPSAREDARSSARHHYQEEGARRVAIIYDTRNLAYSESWLREYLVPFQELGGEVVPVPFESGQDADADRIARQALASRPDAVVMITGAADTARLAQRVRELSPRPLLLGAAQWATTQRLIELGGSAVEGLVVHNYFDNSATSERFVRLQQQYRERFRRDIDFAGVTAYDATQVALAALGAHTSDKRLREILLAGGPFMGADGPIAFDANGDNGRRPHVMVVRDGRFQILR